MLCTCFPSPEKRSASGACVVPFAREGGRVLPLFEDHLLVCAVHAAIQTHDFTAKENELLVMYPEAVIEPRLILVGLGEKKNISIDGLREAFAGASALLRKKLIPSCSCLPPCLEELSETAVLRAVLEGFFLGSYSFSYYKTSPEESPLEELSCCALPALFHEVERSVRVRMEAMQLTRDLVNKNADEISPDGFCHVAQSLAKDGLKIEVHGKDWIEKERMGLFLAVAQGARWEPKFIVARWEGAPQSREKTVLIGKGITFDTGGLDLKGADFLKTMKGDMAGAATVLGVMQAVRDLHLPINVEGVMPLCENSIGERSYKPEDVFISRSGISVEIANTDAEGRLILADAIDYAKEKLTPSRIIDIATLTGAAEVALGNELSALFSNTDALALELVQASHRAGELFWRLPLQASYAKLLESDIADCKNVGPRSGGAITAAVFLQKFVGDLPWAHLDIAGTAFLKEAKRYFSKGATGVPVRTLVDFLEKSSSKVVVDESFS